VSSKFASIALICGEVGAGDGVFCRICRVGLMKVGCQCRVVINLRQDFFFRKNFITQEQHKKTCDTDLALFYCIFNGKTVGSV
jgi:hypothetical protein